MGIIARQSFKSVIVTYVGVAIGVINTMYVYTKMLSVEQFGEITFLHTTSVIFASLILFGLSGVLVRFYPKYKNQAASKKALYSLVFGLLVINSLIFSLLYLIFRADLLDFLSGKEEVYLGTTYAIIVMAISQSLIKLLTSLASIHGRIAIPTLLTQLIKVIQPGLIILFFLQLISFEQVIYGLMFYYLILALVYLFYTNSLEKIHFKPMLRGYPFDVSPKIHFAFFAVFTTFGSILMNQVDVVMITRMLGKHGTGLYGWSMFIPNSIAIPYSLIGVLSTPLIAKYWKENDKASLDKIYKQSSSTLLGVSLGLFIAVYVGIDHLYALLPKGDEYSMGKSVVIFLALAKIMDMTAGLNDAILSMSSRYRILLLFLIIAVISNIGFNLLLIPKFGVSGSAYATFITLAVYNAIKYFYIKYKFGLSPFTSNTALVALLGVLVLFVTLLIPTTGNALVNIIILSGFAVSTYFLLLYRFNLAPELNNFVNKQLIRLGIKPFDKK